MKELKLGVKGVGEFFSQARRSARRIDKGDFEPATPSISFTSMEHLLTVLTPNRWTLLTTLRASGPSSIRALAKTLSRDYRGVHADVSALIEVGLVERDEERRVLVPWSKITAEMSMDAAA